MTSKLRTVLADDEPLALDFLSSILGDHPLVAVEARCAHGGELLALLNEGFAAIDLLFLDIDMPGLTGLDLARAVREQMDPAPMVIFATAHAEFAVDAFAADAVDYVLKPFEPERVLAAVEKASVQRPFRLAARHGLPAVARDTLPVKSGGRTDLVRIEDILWAEAAGDYAVLHGAGREHTVRMTLRDLEAELVSGGFLRVHRSALVRAAAVQSLTALPKGEAMLTLTDGTEVKASRTHRDAIVTLLERK